MGSGVRQFSGQNQLFPVQLSCLRPTQFLRPVRQPLVQLETEGIYMRDEGPRNGLAGVDAKQLADLTQDEHQGHLAAYPHVRLRSVRRPQVASPSTDRLVLADQRVPRIQYRQMLVTDIEEVPQSNGVNRRLRVGRVPARRTGVSSITRSRIHDPVIELVQIDVARASNGEPGERPRDIAQPVHADAQRTEILQADAAVEHGAGHKTPELLVADFVELSIVGLVARSHGTDASREDGGASTQTLQRLIFARDPVNVRIQP